MIVLFLDLRVCVMLIRVFHTTSGVYPKFIEPQVKNATLVLIVNGESSVLRLLLLLSKNASSGRLSSRQTLCCMKQKIVLFSENVI